MTPSNNPNEKYLENRLGADWSGVSVPEAGELTGSPVVDSPAGFAFEREPDFDFRFLLMETQFLGNLSPKFSASRHAP